MNEEQFYETIRNLSEQYDKQNAWFGFQSGGKWDKGTWLEYIDAAWALYENARSNQLGMIVLGDTKIRSDGSLIFNFGWVGNSDKPQEKKDIKLMNILDDKRSMLARPTPSFFQMLNPFINRKKELPVKVMGKGSILSAYRWSPLLNDALMIGGIEADMDFHLALNEDEQLIFRDLTMKFKEGDGVALQKHITGKQSAKLQKILGAPAYESSFQNIPNLDPKEVWLQFLRKVPRVIYEGGRPRVFARELLGLSIFNYRPHFSLHELGFSRDPGCGSPTFKEYLDGLNSSGMTGDQAGKADPTPILKAISKFLFKDENALL